MIARSKEDIEILANAIKYLQKYADDSSIQIVCVDADKPAFIKALATGDPRSPS